MGLKCISATGAGLSGIGIMQWAGWFIQMSLKHGTIIRLNV